MIKERTNPMLTKMRSIMTKTIHAWYENGVLRPTEKVDVPDPCEVEVEIRQIKGELKRPTLDDVYAILGRRHASGEHDLAERHNEHQP
jgi:predicted DNA-binding antitoxin AbrB/MazE fold protein